MTNEEREEETRKQPIPTKEECLAFYKELMKLADARFVPYYKMAIETLEQQPCNDCVSRKHVDQLIDELARAISDERCCMSRGRSTSAIIEDILHLPSVKPQPEFYPPCQDCNTNRINDKIQIGDEVYSFDERCRYIVVQVCCYNPPSNMDYAICMNAAGNTFSCGLDLLHRTGRRFETIAYVLEQLEKD